MTSGDYQMALMQVRAWLRSCTALLTGEASWASEDVAMRSLVFISRKDVESLLLCRA